MCLSVYLRIGLSINVFVFILSISVVVRLAIHFRSILLFFFFVFLIEKIYTDLCTNFLMLDSFTSISRAVSLLAHMHI